MAINRNFTRTTNANLEVIKDLRGNPVGFVGDLDDEQLFVTAKENPLTGVIGKTAGDTVLVGTLVSGAWAAPPSIFRLLLNGTGIVTLDSRDAAGVITPNVFSQTLNNAVNLIAFPYAGDSAISIRATLTGTATTQVI